VVQDAAVLAGSVNESDTPRLHLHSYWWHFVCYVLLCHHLNENTAQGEEALPSDHIPLVGKHPVCSIVV
jgi:hypothetical protein